MVSALGDRLSIFTGSTHVVAQKIARGISPPA